MGLRNLVGKVKLSNFALCTPLIFRRSKLGSDFELKSKRKCLLSIMIFFDLVMINPTTDKK